MVTSAGTAQYPRVLRRQVLLTAVPAVPKTLLGTAQYPIPLWVLCSTRSTHRYCGTAAGTVGTVQYPIDYGTAQYRGTAGGYCTVHKKIWRARYLFGNTYRTTPGLNLELPVCMGMQ